MSGRNAQTFRRAVIVQPLVENLEPRDLLHGGHFSFGAPMLGFEPAPHPERFVRFDRDADFGRGPLRHDGFPDRFGQPAFQPGGPPPQAPGSLPGSFPTGGPGPRANAAAGPVRRLQTAATADPPRSPAPPARPAPRGGPTLPLIPVADTANPVVLLTTLATPSPRTDQVSLPPPPVSADEPPPPAALPGQEPPGSAADALAVWTPDGRLAQIAPASLPSEAESRFAAPPAANEVPAVPPINPAGVDAAVVERAIERFLATLAAPVADLGAAVEPSELLAWLLAGVAAAAGGGYLAWHRSRRTDDRRRPYGVLALPWELT